MARFITTGTMSNREWTGEEDSLLKERWGTVIYTKDMEILACRLNHTISEVRTRATQLKIKERFNIRGDGEKKGGSKRVYSQNSPNTPEAILEALLQANFPGEYRFNGDNSQGVTLGGLIPDWINVNGKKQVIELFGDYWHSDKVIKSRWKRSEFGRKAVFSQLGFECIVIWEHELEFPTNVIEKVKSYQRDKDRRDNKKRKIEI